MKTLVRITIIIVMALGFTARSTQTDKVAVDAQATKEVVTTPEPPTDAENNHFLKS